MGKVNIRNLGAAVGGMLVVGGMGMLLHLAFTKIQERVSRIYQSHEKHEMNALIVSPPRESLAKMLKNAVKAVREHRKAVREHRKAVREHRKECCLNDSLEFDETDLDESGVVPSLESLEAGNLEKPLQLSVAFHTDQGQRESMEDAHFFATIPEGMILGVFDGHGGSKVANYANNEFQKRFRDKLRNLNGDIRQVFEKLIKEIHVEVCRCKKWDKEGSTALVSFVDTNNGIIYTATLGDSEANIYRENTSIPLSCVRDWKSQKDAARAADSYQLNGHPDLAEKAMKNWPKERSAKNLRYPFPRLGVNVSRAIGDQQVNVNQAFTHEIKDGVVSHKPKITVNRVMPGDTVVLACDGLRDFVSEQRIIEVLKENRESDQARALVEEALETSTDNVTVVVLNIS